LFFEGKNTSQSTVLTLGYYGLSLLINLSLPLLLSALVIGLTVSLLQATSSIQEQTLSFVPKMITVFSVALLIGPSMLAKMLTFFKYVITNIPDFLIK